MTTENRPAYSAGEGGALKTALARWELDELADVGFAAEKGLKWCGTSPDWEYDGFETVKGHQIMTATYDELVAKIAEIEGATS